MIFIFNQGNDASESSLIEFLKDNNLNDLIERVGEQKKENKLSYKDKYKNKNLIKAEKKTKYNIVLLNLLKDENSGKKVYGIDTLLELTLYFMRKDNPFSEECFNSLIDYKQMLSLTDISKNDRKIIEDEIKKIYKKLSKENSFLSNIVSIDSIIANAHFNNEIFRIKTTLMYSMFFLFIFHKKKISEYIYVFKKIEHNYKIYTDEIMLKPIIDFGENKKTFKGFDIVKFYDENDQSKKEIKDNLKLLEESPDSTEVNKGFYINNEFYKEIAPFYGFLQSSFYNIIIDYFDKYLRETCCIEYVCKQKEIYVNIFKQLEKMSKKNDWDKFHPLIFK